MNRFFILLAASFLAFALYGVVQAASILFPYQGGTGTSTVPGDDSILIGYTDGKYLVKTFTAGTDISFSEDGDSFTINSSAAGGGTFAWTPNPWGNSTSTVLGFLTGFISNGASSTVSGFLRVHGELFASSTINSSSAGTSTISGILETEILNVYNRFRIGDSSTTTIFSNRIVMPGVSSPTHAEGQFFYDTDNNTYTIHNEESEIALQIGQENYIRVRNISGSTISNGTVVYINGFHGATGLATIALADASALATSLATGLATHDIENNSNGYVTTQGLVRNFDTSLFSEGDIMYLSTSTAGDITNKRPQQPDFTIIVGQVARSHATQGDILVSINTRKFGGYTSGAVAFGGTDGFLKEDLDNFIWDNTNNRLGLGTTTPSRRLSVQGAGQFSDKLTAGDITATGTFTGLGTGTSTFSGGIDMIGANINLPSCNGSNALATDAAGAIICDTDDNTGGGGDPGLIVSLLTGTHFNTSSSTGNAFLFQDGFVSSGASSTISDTLQLGGGLNASSTGLFDDDVTLGGASSTISGTLRGDGLFTLNGGLTLEDGDTFTFSGDALTDLQGDATISVVSGALRVVDVNCTDCLTVTEIDESGDWTGTLDGIEGASFLRSDAADTGTGLLTLSGGIMVTASSTFGADLFFTEGLYGSSTLMFGTSTLSLSINEKGQVVSGTTTNAFTSVGQSDATSTPGFFGTLLHIDSGHNGTSTQQRGDVGNPACFKIRDKLDDGWSYCGVQDGTWSCSTVSC